jgi:hypothetical protein
MSMMAWIFVALLAVFSADAGVVSADVRDVEVQSLDDPSFPFPPKP